MAGGGEALGGGGKQRRGKAGKRKGKKRLGFRLDMTPLVDITFLLLTFFMLTTSMITPQTMELNMPIEETEVEVAMSKLLTIRVRDDGKVFTNMGVDEPQPVTPESLRKIVVDQNVALDNGCIVVLKSGKNVPYGVVVNILDILNAAEPAIEDGLRRKGINERKRKFTVAKMEDKDLEQLRGL